MRDEQRREWLRDGMAEAGLDALIVSLPANVLMATGYFPIVGTSVAIVTREGEIDLIAPDDENEFAENSGADRLVTFRPGALDKLTSAAEAIRQPLNHLLRCLVGDNAAIGFDETEATEPASYVAMHIYGCSLPEIVERGRRRQACELIASLKARLTPREIECVGRSCRIAATAFERGRERLEAGREESEAAACFRSPLFTVGTGFEGAHRAGGDAFCMAGGHSAKAYGAFAHSRSSEIPPSSFVLAHCNSHADGYWTDITRTYCTPLADDWHRELYDAVFQARTAALSMIRPGVKGRDVDAAARNALRSRGFADNFKHGTGHGVGFHAISPNARPRIHPASEDVLAPGMVFNVEPAIYIEGRGGIRHCDMVAVTGNGPDLLTPFHCGVDDLILR